MIQTPTHFTTPFTRIVLLCSAVSIIASFALLSSLWCALILLPLMISIFLYNSIDAKLLVALTLLTSASVCLRIYQIKNNFQKDSFLLKDTVTFGGTINQVQHNTQDREVTSLLIETSVIVSKENNELTAYKTILVQVPYSRAKRLKAGQSVIFYSVKLEQPTIDDLNSKNQYGLYLIKEGIWATAYVSSEKFKITKQEKLATTKQYFNYLSHYFNETTKHLYNPLFLGKKEKDSLSLHIQHQSLYWGIAHHMARSGIHLVTLLGLLIAFFHYGRMRSRFRFGVCAALIAGYGLITIPSISFIRSMIMIMIQMFSRLNGFQYSGIHAFALTTLIVVQYNPFYVLFLDFQLSFGITAVIIWLFHIKWAKTVAFPLASLLRF